MQFFTHEFSPGGHLYPPRDANGEFYGDFCRFGGGTEIHMKKTKLLPTLFATFLLAAGLLTSCGGDPAKTTDTTTTAAPHEHNWDVNRMEPTCTENGFETSYCLICGETKTDILPATGHTWVESTVEPTCTEQGYTLLTCSACGETEKKDFTPAKGHTYEVKTVAPTYFEQGYDLHTCTDCGDSYRDNFVPMISSTVVVLFNAEGGELDGEPGAKYRTNDTVTLPTPRRTGYTFMGWFDEAGNEYKSGVWTYPYDVTLHAAWQANTFTVTFNPNGGSVKTTSVTMAYASTYGFLPVPDERFGYLFLGWYDGDTLVNGNTVYDHLSDVTLTARWKEPYASGSCGTDLTWTTCADGITRITGTGKTISAGAFEGVKNVWHVIVPESVTNIEAGAFRGCPELTTVELPASIEHLRSEVFKDCTALEKVTIAEGIASINFDTFAGCTALKELSIPKSVLQLYSPFTGCTALKDIYYEGSAFMWSCVVKDTAAEAFLSDPTVTIHFAQ